MFEKDSTIINTLYSENAEFKALLDDHVCFEQDLEALYSTHPFTELVATKIKEIKRLKLNGKDRYYMMIEEYKRNNNL